MSKSALLGLFLFFIVRPGWGQTGQIDSLHSVYDQMYGLDVTLNNGKKYIPDAAPVKGHPFWGGDAFFEADLTISGKTFRNRQLKYNLSKQEFLLHYTDLNGQKCQIILNSPFIDSVKTSGGLFVRNSCPEIELPFVKRIYQGKLACCVGLRKKLEFAAIGVNTGYSYSKESRTYYLVRSQKAEQFTNKASFVKLFPAGNRATIREKIARLRLKFKKMDEKLLKQLVEFCDHTVG